MSRRLVLAVHDVAAVLGSGDEQAKAKLYRIEIDQLVVAFGPPT
jgi:hypothetical protein